MKEPEEYTGTFVREIFRRGDFCIGIVKLSQAEEDGPNSMKIIGEFDLVQEGEQISFSGEWEKDRRGDGDIFRVHLLAPALPHDQQGMIEFLQRFTDQIGPTLAERIVEAFGSDTIDVLNTAPLRLLEVEGVGEGRVTAIVDAWREHQYLHELLTFLCRIGVPPRFLRRIHDRWGEKAQEIIKDNPYSLIELDGISFRTADKAGLRAGIDRESVERMAAACWHTLKTIERNGHTCFPLTEFEDEVYSTLQDEEGLEDLPLRGLERLVEQGKVSLVEDEEEGEAFVYLARTLEREQYIGKRLRALSRDRGHPLHFNKAAWQEGVGSLELSKGQEQALHLALNHHALIVTGGPGTGKTTLLKALLMAFESADVEVFLCSPTGRAAKRMEEVTGQPAMTIHRALHFCPSNRSKKGEKTEKEDNQLQGGWGLNRDNPLPPGVVIVDEASMLDNHLTFRIMDALPEDGSLILIGDVDQLPSVGNGNVLRDILLSGVLPTMRLTEVFRQAQSSMIIRNAHRINQGRIPRSKADEGRLDDFRWVKFDDPDEAREAIVSRMIKEHLSGVYKGGVQVLAPTYAGPLGVDLLNEEIQKRLNPHNPVLLEQHGHKIKLRDKVIHTRNNYDLSIFNGDIGVVVPEPSDLAPLQWDIDLAARIKVQLQSKKALVWVEYPDRPFPVP